MKTKRALLLILIVAALACGCLFGCGSSMGGYDPGGRPTYRPPTNEPENYGYRYTVIEGEVRIDGYMSRPGVVEKKHEIPSEIDGYTVTVIADEAFRSNRTIEEIIIPDTVKTIGQKAFMYSYITSIVIPSSVREIGADAFHSCIELQKVYFSDGLTSIGKDAFVNCVMLTEADLSQNRGLTELDGTFTDCFKLSALKLPSSITRLSGDALGNTGIESFHIHKELATIDLSFNSCRKLKEITVDENNPSFTAIDGVLFDKELESLRVYPMKKPDESYTVPSGVKWLEHQAIYKAENLFSIDLNQVETILRFGLSENANLATIVGDNVKSLHENALKGTKWFEENDDEFFALGKVLIKYNGDRKEVDLTQYYCIEEYAFYGNESLEKVYFGEETRFIRRYAFADCPNLKEVYCFNDTYSGIMLGVGVFDGNAEGRKIYIPQKREQNYLDGEYWQPYADSFEFVYSDVEYHTFGGTIVGEYDTRVAYGGYIAFPEIKKDYYYFEGWYDGEEDGNGAGNCFYNGAFCEVPFETIHAYAKWAPRTYNLYLVPNGGTVENASTYFTVEDEVELPTPTREHYIFEGWYRDKDFSEDSLISEVLPAGTHESVVLYAKWKGETYTVTYDFKDIKLEGLPTTDTVTYGEDFELYVPSIMYCVDGYDEELGLYVRTGYIFDGWQDETGRRVCGKDGKCLYISGSDIGKDTTLTIIWTLAEIIYSPTEFQTSAEA